jgi:hypothetical protein
MNRSDPSQAWVLRSRALLQQSADALDGATQSRLTRARHAALDQLQTRAVAPAWLRGFGLSAVALGLAVVLWRGLLPVLTPADPVPGVAQVVSQSPAALPAVIDAPPSTDPQVDAAVAEPDFDLLVDAESYPLLEDLEFYAWLDQVEGRDG